MRTFDYKLTLASITLPLKIAKRIDFTRFFLKEIIIYCMANERRISNESKVVGNKPFSEMIKSTNKIVPLPPIGRL